MALVLTREITPAPGPAADGLFANQYPLKRYLASCKLPWFRPARAAKTQFIRSPPWPVMKELACYFDGRYLRNVFRLDTTKLAQGARSYYNFLPEVLIEGTTNGEDDEVLGLRLPSWELLAYDEEDINLLKSLSEQSNEGHVSTLIQDYILATVTESIKIIERLPSGTPLHEAVQFKRSLVVPSVAFPRLVIHELRPTMHEVNPLAVISLPPWAMGKEQFEQSVSPRHYSRGALDLRDSQDNVPASDKLWAMIYDECVNRGHYFVVHNYKFWAFGTFSADYSSVKISEAMEAPLMDATGETNSVPDMGYTVIEYLIYWVQCARGAAIPPQD